MRSLKLTLTLAAALLAASASAAGNTPTQTVIDQQPAAQIQNEPENVYTPAPTPAPTNAVYTPPPSGTAPEIVTPGEPATPVSWVFCWLA